MLCLFTGHKMDQWNEAALAALIKEFLAHQNRMKYTKALVAYETGQSPTTINSILLSRHKSSNKSATTLRKFIDQYNADFAKFKNMIILDLLLEPIRTLHLGGKFEKQLLSGEIFTIQDLVVKTPSEIREITNLGAIPLRIIEERLNQAGLKFGMNIDQEGTIITTMTIKITGSRGQGQAVINSLLRHARTKIKVEEIDIKIKAEQAEVRDSHKNGPVLRTKKFKEKDSNNFIDRYPIQLQMAVQSGNHKMEIANKKFRSPPAVAAFMSDIAEKLKPLKNAKAFEKSDVWVLEI